MDDMISNEEVPMGLGMALARNLSAMNYFGSLSRQEQQQVIDKTHSITSKEEMQSYVNSLADRNKMS